MRRYLAPLARDAGGRPGCAVPGVAFGIRPRIGSSQVMREHPANPHNCCARDGQHLPAMSPSSQQCDHDSSAPLPDAVQDRPIEIKHARTAGAGQGRPGSGPPAADTLSTQKTAKPLFVPKHTGFPFPYARLGGGDWLLSGIRMSEAVSGSPKGGLT